MPLSRTQIRYLRGLAHGLQPVVMVGGKGITPTLLEELDSALNHHELVKVRISAADRVARDLIALELAQTSSAETVQKIGNIICLFRRNKEKPQLVLPR